jgi:hypothetical protein
MATKPSVTTQLRNSKNQIVDLEAQVVKLNASLTTKENSSKYTYEQKVNLENEVEQLHAVLDVLEGSPPRKYLPNPEEAWKVVENSALVRLAGYLAANRK